MQITQLNVSTRQLRAFIALAELKNFTRAAAQTNLSQPAFSALIRALESSVGTRLFDRNTRNVNLTAEGSLFLEGAVRLLRDFEHTMTDLGEHAARRRGRVSLAALPALAAGWLPDVLAAFRGEYPGIELDIADELSEDCVERVRSGRADFALAAIRASAPELSTDLFCADRFHLVCRRDHPLARRRRITLADLSDQPFVHLARTSSVRQHIEAAVWPAQMRRVMELEQLSTVAGMVRAGMGVTVVPMLTLFLFGHPELITKPLSAPELRREIFLIRPRDHGLSMAAQALCEFMVKRRPRTDA
jgi:LysR family transcriptional regulator, carnitine catabolism transcriptional activator